MTCCAKYSGGDLRETVTFQRKTRADDGSGGYSEAWADIAGAPTRAKVKPLSGREVWASARLEARSTHMVVVRYTDAIDERDRIVIRGLNYQIRFIRNVDMADKWLEISAELGAAP